MVAVLAAVVVAAGWRPPTPAGTSLASALGRPTNRRSLSSAPTHEAMSGDAVYEMVRRRAEQAGYTTTPDQPARRALPPCRAGFVTEAFRQGADAHQIMRQTGHRSHTVLETCAREHAPLVAKAVTRIGL